MHINPPSELAVRIARYMVTHPERFQQIPERDTVYRRNWATLLTDLAARRHARLTLCADHSGDAA